MYCKIKEDEKCIIAKIITFYLLKNKFDMIKNVIFTILFVLLTIGCTNTSQKRTFSSEYIQNDTSDICLVLTEENKIYWDNYLIEFEDINIKKKEFISNLKDKDFSKYSITIYLYSQYNAEYGKKILSEFHEFEDLGLMLLE